MTNKFNTEENKLVFKQFTFWVKFFSILGFITAGIMILVGIPLLLAFGLGLIYIAIGCFYIFLARKLWSASKSSSELSEIEDEGEFTNKLIDVITDLKGYYRIMGIITVIGLVLGLIGGLFTGIAFATFLSNTNFDEIRDLDPNSPTYEQDIERIFEDQFDLDLENN